MNSTLRWSVSPQLLNQFTHRASFFTTSRDNPVGGPVSWSCRPCKRKKKLKPSGRSMKLKPQFFKEVTVMKTKNGGQDVETPPSLNLIKVMGDVIHLHIKKLGFFKFIFGSELFLTGSVKMVWLTILALNPRLVMVMAAFSLIQPFVEAWVAIMTKIERIKNPTGKFDDLVGLVAQKAALQEIVPIFVRDGSYLDIVGTLPKGVLLYGSEGTGKTSLIHAMAGEIRVPLFSISASDLATHAFLVRCLFHEARSNAPCIILIDDIEAISGDPILNELLIQIQKLEKDACVMVIATTNKLDKLEIDLMIHDGFFKKIQVDKPNKDERGKIFAKQMKGIVLKEYETIYNFVASETEDLVWGHLEKAAQKCKRLAASEGRKCVTMDDALKAVQWIKYYIYGETKPSYSLHQTAQEGN